MDKCIEVCDLSPLGPCQTVGLMLDGGHDWSRTLFIRLIQDFGVDNPVRSHSTVVNTRIIIIMWQRYQGEPSQRLQIMPS